MPTRVSSILLASVTMIIAGVGVFGQNAPPLREEIHAAMKRSFDQTKNGPFRTTTTVETGSSPTTPIWQAYSSWVIEVVPPDRSFLAYTSGRKGEFIRIGTERYTREDRKSEWVPDETGMRHSFPNPGSTIGINGPEFEYYNISSTVSAPDSTVYRVVKNPPPGTENFKNKIVTWTYWFNKEGIIYKHDAIGYNGFNWVRTTSVYEYDPDIKIEAPIIKID